MLALVLEELTQEMVVEMVVQAGLHLVGGELSMVPGLAAQVVIAVQAEQAVLRLAEEGMASAASGASGASGAPPQAAH